MSGFEHLEHTADVGIKAWSDSLEGCFEQATLGLLDIMGAYEPQKGEPVAIEVEARDLGGLLVDWLSEVLYIQDSRDATVSSVDVHEVTEGRTARGTIEVVPRAVRYLEGTAVKAITYHQLDIGKEGDGWSARVFVDV